MLIIPAIDIKNGKCVRLLQGDLNSDTIYSSDLLTVADQWVEQGAKRLHLVDLDGAVTGMPVHFKSIQEICKQHPNLPVQVGGGIRSLETVEAYFDAGVSYIIVGTRAVNEPQFIESLSAKFPEKIIVGLDARDGNVAINGWTRSSDNKLTDVARKFEHMRLAAIIYTDIVRDGMLSGVNLESTLELAQSTKLPVIASGGIKDLEDIRSLLALPAPGVTGAITGRAIYEGTLNFKQAQSLASESNNAC